MLRAASSKKNNASGHRFAIVASTYNARYVNSMCRAAEKTLAAAGAAEIKVVRVPGAFEVPLAAAALAEWNDPSYAAVICLGVILRGRTSHAQHIAEAVTQALVQIQLDQRKPVIHEVLLLENDEQAVQRCLDAKHNRGIEAAQTAIAMANLLKELSGAAAGKTRSKARNRSNKAARR